MRWSDVTYLWPQCDRHFVGQHVVLCVVKSWRFVALFKLDWISWFKKMSVLSLSYWESDVYWRQNNKHFAELAPQNGWYEEITSLSPYVYTVFQKNWTLCYFLISLRLSRGLSHRARETVGLEHSLANWDSCPTPAKSEGIEYLQVGPTVIVISLEYSTVVVGVSKFKFTWFVNMEWLVFVTR